MLFLGIDSGTQSTKCVVLELETGKIIAQASESYDLIGGLPDGHLEQNPQDWIDATCNTIASCVEQIGERKGEVRAIGVSGQQHGCVTLDGDDQIVRPAKLWCDTSTQEQCEKFADEFGGQDGLIELAGNAMLPGYTAPKILWMEDHEPDNFAATQSVLLPHDFINFWLTGEKRMEFGDASGTGLLDVRNRDWCHQLLDFIDPRVTDMLPQLGSSKDPQGMLKPDLAEQFGLPKDVVISAGGGDNMMGAIGTGNIKSGVITASFGTSGTLYGCSDKPIIDPKGEVAAFCDSTDQWLPLVCTMNVTVTTEQVRTLFGWDLDKLESAVSSAEPGADGLTFLPYLNGERTPNLPNGSGVLHGLKTANFTPENVARAAMEGATLGLAYGLRRFQELGLEPTEIRLTGGGSQSPTWRQISADAFGVPVVTLSTAEGASLGAALQAAHVWHRSQGTERSYEELCAGAVELDESTRAEPNPAAAGVYAEQLEKLGGLTQTLAGAGYL
ncbi:MAG: xylulokinase [Verrucomicrobiales bacterium]|jgi:xylulokinase